MGMLNPSILTLRIFLLCLTAPILAVAVPSDPRDVNPVEVGSALPEVQLTDTEGKQHALSEVVGSEKSILIFYRGSWCPYCTRHLAAIGQYEQTILDKGYRIIAISPDQPEATQDYAEEAEFNYSIYADPDLSATKAFGLAFERVHRKTGGTQILPVPAVFITDAEGRITFRHFDANYRERLEPEALLKALDN